MKKHASKDPNSWLDKNICFSCFPKKSKANTSKLDVRSKFNTSLSD